MEKLPMISIIISTYNRRKYLEIAINSVLAQTYQNFEFIIINDNSTDQTREFLNQYNEDKRFIINHNKKNQGPGINRKMALENYAKGDYIIFLDDDDEFINNQYFDKAIKLFLKYPNLSIVSAPHIIYNKLDNSTTEVKFAYEELIDNKEFFMNFQTEKFIKPIPSVSFFRKQALEETGYTTMKILNDTAIFLRAILWGPMGFVNEVSMKYLIHGKNISFDCDVNLIKETLEEKYHIYQKANTFFSFTKEELEQWFYKQCDVTIYYFIKGSKPNWINFKKIMYWCQKRIKDKNRIMEYKKFYKANQSIEKSI